MKYKSQILAITKKERLTIPPRNYRNYDIECASYADAIEKEPARFNELSIMLWKRIQDFKRKDKSFLPPLLCREQDEPTKDYLDRCYVAGGYSNYKPITKGNHHASNAA